MNDYDLSDVPWYNRWLAKRLEKPYWPRWLKKDVLDGRIDVCVYHQNREEAARVARDWIAFALEESFGNKYLINVYVRAKSIPEDLSPDEAMGYVRDELGYADDVNAIAIDHGDNTGGGSVCKFKTDHKDLQGPDGDIPDIDDVAGESPRLVTPNEPPYDYLHSAVHEVGHCLGFGHDAGGVYDGKVSPMTYADANQLLFKYRETDTPEVVTEW